MKSKLAMANRHVSTQLRKARELWGHRLSNLGLHCLRELLEHHSLSVTSGELLLLEGRWYVTHAGLLRLAARSGCSGIRLQPVREFCDPQAARWAFKATVYKTQKCKGFVGYGDASPSNVSHLVRGSEMRVAETRAVNRALRKAYGIGICSVEELSALATPPAGAPHVTPLPTGSRRANPHGAHPLRERLCLLIRKHGLDGKLVKLYAADFCGAGELRQASREQVGEFVSHLAQYAEHDRAGLLCRLNSYAPKASAPAVVDKDKEGNVAGAA